MPDPAKIGAVAIGRNEGERLKRCLRSLVSTGVPIIYVDSGSHDDSVEFANSLGVPVIDLDMSIPFTAARARNAGYEKLIELHPDIAYVQFVDGDCEVAGGWLDMALQEMESGSDLGVVTGWRSEINPHESVYNAMCDDEWHAPAGPITACGGDMMIRRAAFDQVGGFTDTVIAAEDDEFCIRIGAAGWQLVRLPNDMTLHDADMHNFGQWWKRAVRAGHGFAQVGDMHPGYFAAPRRRIMIYAVALPALALIGLLFWWPILALTLAIYAASFTKSALSMTRSGKDLQTALHHAIFIVLSKFPNLVGFVRYYLRKRRGAEMRIIEYK